MTGLGRYIPRIQRIAEQTELNIIALIGIILLIGLGAGLRTLQRIERTLASRPMPRALPIAEGAKAAESVETSREPVRVPFAP